VWIIEFIGGGKSSRALIRKGSLRHLVQHTSAGTLVSVFDENMKPLENPYVQLGSRRFDPIEGGGVLIPFSTQPGEQNVILGDGSGFTTLEKINIGGEKYDLKAGFHVPRESLLPGATAKVAIRPALLVNGLPSTPDVLEKVRLTVSSHTLDGVPSSAVYDIATLAPDAETVIEFAVPDRLASLSFSLEAEVKSLVTGQPVKLSAGDSLRVNGLSLTEQTSDLYLTNADGQFLLEERGRTGEARVDREVVVTFTRPDFSNTITQTLKTDESGFIALGKLDGIARITARSATGVERNFTVPRTWASLPAAATLHAGPARDLAGHAIHLPRRVDR